MSPLVIAAVIMAGVIVLLLILEYLAAEVPLLFVFNHRADGCLRFEYTLPSDFPNLKTKKFSVKSRKNTLYGFEYCDVNVTEYKAVVLLSHGLGCGHFYLLYIINELCKAGYIVVAYDQTSSGMSTGKHIFDMSQSLGDIERVYKYVDSREEYKKYDLYTIGHSWGAYSVLNLLNLRGNRVKKCVAFAGFNCNADIITRASKVLTLTVPGIFIYDLIHHGKYAFYSSSRALKHTEASVLCIHGEKDVVVPLCKSYEKYRRISAKKANIHTVLYEGKGHSPFLTVESEQTQNRLSQGLGMVGEREPAPDLRNDYKKTYRLDPKVIGDMLDFFDE